MIKNANRILKESYRWNDKIGLFITGIVGTMWAAYIFTILAFISFPAAIASGNSIIIVAWIAQTFLQLVLLPIIIVGQNLQGKHAEIRAELDYETNVKAEKEIETMLRHLQEIDERTLKLVEKL